MRFGVLRWQPCCPQGNSESDKYHFNTAFLTGSDYYRYPKHLVEMLNILIYLRIKRQKINLVQMYEV